jgi:hypothetical protein
MAHPVRYCGEGRADGASVILPYELRAPVLMEFWLACLGMA